MIALSQLNEARQLRLDQAQPYVVVSMDQTRPHSKAIDLVVKNLGKTAARNVHIAMDPTPQRAAGGKVEPIWLPDEIPVLAPGQEWRTLWDFTTARGNLPDRYTATVRYEDERGVEFVSRTSSRGRRTCLGPPSSLTTCTRASRSSEGLRPR